MSKEDKKNPVVKTIEAKGNFEFVQYQQSLTLRDIFACFALASMKHMDGHGANMARSAYNVADYMIAEREKGRVS